MKKTTALFFLLVLALLFATGLRPVTIWRHFGAIPKIVPPGLQSPRAEEKEKFTKEQKLLLELHNSNRESKGMKPLEIDENLCEYAQKHAEYMAAKESMRHSSMSDLQKHSGAGTVGENIAWGQETPEDVVSAWMWSPMHRWNILGSSYNKVGFGIKEDSDGRKYWCTVFSN